ncbi:MAG: phosphotransferase family protein, partial [Acidimicrobiia bacterium]
PGCGVMLCSPHFGGRARSAAFAPPTKVAALVAADGLVRATTVPVPELVMVDPGEGIVEWAELPGRSLHDLLGDEAVPLGVVTAAAAAAGHAVRAMHSAPVSEPARHHTAADEVANMARWVGPVGILASTPPGIERALDAAVALLSEPASAPVLVHRDLHDKQILVEGDEAGMIDVDTIAKGEAAVDLANLLVHLELRAALGVAPSRTQAAADSFLDAYRPSADVRARIGAYAAATRVRLACVYAFRPAQAVAAAQLLAGPP